MTEAIWDATRLDELIERVRGGEVCSKLGSSAYDILRLMRFGLQLGNEKGITDFRDQKLGQYGLRSELIMAARKEEFNPLPASLARAVNDLKTLNLLGLEYYASSIERDMGAVRGAAVTVTTGPFGRLPEINR